MYTLYDDTILTKQAIAEKAIVDIDIKRIPLDVLFIHTPRCKSPVFVSVLSLNAKSLLSVVLTAGF